MSSSVAEFDDFGRGQRVAHLVDDARAGSAARRGVDHQHHARAVGSRRSVHPQRVGGGDLGRHDRRHDPTRRARRCPRRCRSRRTRRRGSARRWPPGTARPAPPAGPGPARAAGSPARHRRRTRPRWPSGPTAANSTSGIGGCCRISGTDVRLGRGRFQTRLATWLVNRLVTARLTTPRAAPRRMTVPAAPSRGRDDEPQLGMVRGPAQPGHRGVQQRAGRLRDGLEHLAVEGAEPLADLGCLRRGLRSNRMSVNLASGRLPIVSKPLLDHG